MTLVTGRIYRVKYSSTNIHGESELSDEVSILLAEVPAAPSDLQRIDMTSVTAGDIRVHWALPADEGGDPVLGYRLYLDGVLMLDASTQSTLNEYTYTGLSVGNTYRLSVTAVNDIGESEHSHLDLLAASVPQKLSLPIMVVSTQSSIEIEATSPQFDGGSPVTLFVYMRDSGPLTPFEPQVTSSDAQYTFTGLTPGVIYRFKVAAINLIGQGEWSAIAGFYACTNPSDAENFALVSQSESHLTVSWEVPLSAGGCPVTGYRVYMENIASPGLKLVYNGVQ